MFKIYDLNMKELPFPEGVKPLDIFVSSVNKRRLTEEFEGRNGTLNYGYDYGERSVDLSLWLEAHDTIDYRLIRNELYAFFDTHDVFYIEETRVPSRVLKVTIDESYIPERINQTHSSVEISCRTLDSVFWESKYTTLELHDSGYSALVEKYGLVDNIDDEKVKYRFEPEILREELTKSEWELGGISSGTGENVISDTLIRTKSYFNTIPGREYVFEELLNSSKILYWWIMEYDNAGNYIGYFATQGNPQTNKGTFTARGSRVRMRPTLRSGQTISVDDIGVNVRPTISGKGMLTSFSVYNAGNVTIEPESMYLNIGMRYVTTSGGFKIRNETTGEEHIINSSHERRHLRLNGMVVTSGNLNNFRNTNRRFISLSPGDNKFTVSGGTFEEIEIDFKYLYK